MYKQDAETFGTSIQTESPLKAMSMTTSSALSQSGQSTSIDRFVLQPNPTHHIKYESTACRDTDETIMERAYFVDLLWFVGCWKGWE